MRRYAFVLSPLVCSGVASAQSAMLSLSHDDPDGLVSPGEVVAVTLRIAWSEPPPNLVLGLLQGDITASPGVGVASNPAFAHANPWANQLTVLNPGTAVGGGLRGVDIQSGLYDPFGTGFGPPPWGVHTGFDVVRFDWEAPSTLGPVEFSWTNTNTIGTGPGPVFFLNGSTIITSPTAYASATLTVVPAPGVGVVLAMRAGAVSRRRRVG